MSEHNIMLKINETDYHFRVTASDTLLNVIREKAGFTGVKKGCETGECGACSVLLDGEPVNSCMVLAVEVDGSSVITIEGLSAKGIHPIQQAYIDAGAVQCGYCTPGMIIVTKALLDRNPQPDDEEIKSYLDGHLCRCTGYTKIIAAVKLAADSLVKEGLKDGTFVGR